jgi:hypothetical protein
MTKTTQTSAKGKAGATLFIGDVVEFNGCSRSPKWKGVVLNFAAMYGKTYANVRFIGGKFAGTTFHVRAVNCTVVDLSPAPGFPARDEQGERVTA